MNDDDRKNADFKYVVCVDNREYEAALERLKIYKTLPDEKAAQIGYLRVIDESGEDYLYPETFFEPIKLPQTVEKLFTAAA